MSNARWPELLSACRNFASGTTTLLHGNHRGDVVLATDSSGSIVHEFEYAPFGNVLSKAGSYEPRFGFSSKERDSSGLTYYGMRYYSSMLCQWISADPLGMDGGVNLYVFCGNAPTIFVDPFGDVAVEAADYWASYAA